ncbi:transposase [Desulfofundulus thermobenzoicus]|uniref:transposase n=1 Tax=Desulfofundulus thermobenzoicus TaxID=29376 RepID=UPI001A9AC64C
MARKQYSPEQKMQMVKEVMETGNASIVGRRYDVAPSLISRWVRTYKNNGTPSIYCATTV